MKRQQPRAILLDMDDTIIAFDHGVDTDACWRRTVRRHMPDQTAEAAEQLITDIKNKAKWYWSEISIYPDSIDTIKQLRNKGIKLALITNGNAQTQWDKINRFDLSPLFDCIVVEGDLGIGKPDERIYAHALKRLEVGADEAWMVGDNFEWEVAAPQRIGIRGVWVDHKGNGVADESSAQPFLIIKSLGDLLLALD